MAMQLGHVHIKTREDPRKVAQFYIDNFGATVKREIPGRGCQLDLHGVQLNVTTIIADQNHEQHVGIEHIAIETDDYAGALANFKKNGAQILEERVNNGRHVCWVAAPDGELHLCTLEEMEQAIQQSARGRKPTEAVTFEEAEEPAEPPKA